MNCDVLALLRCGRCAGHLCHFGDLHASDICQAPLALHKIESPGRRRHPLLRAAARRGGAVMETAGTADSRESPSLDSPGVVVIEDEEVAQLAGVEGTTSSALDDAATAMTVPNPSTLVSSPPPLREGSRRDFDPLSLISNALASMSSTSQRVATSIFAETGQNEVLSRFMDTLSIPHVLASDGPAPAGAERVVGEFSVIYKRNTAVCKVWKDLVVWRWRRMGVVLGDPGLPSGCADALQSAL